MHQSVNTHIRRMMCHLYRGDIELNMDAKSHFVNTVFCVIFSFFWTDLFRVQIHKHWWEMSYLYYGDSTHLSVALYTCGIQSFMFKSYDIRLYGTFLSVEGQRGVSQSMMGNHDNSMVGLAHHGSFLWIRNGWNREPLLIQTWAVGLFLCQTLESYVWFFFCI